MTEDGNTVSEPGSDVGGGGVGDGNAVSIPAGAIERVAIALAERRNLAETMREFALELGKLLDEDTAAVEHFKRGMLAAGSGYVHAYYQRGLRLLAAKRELLARCPDEQTGERVIGTWEDEQGRQQGKTARTIRQWVHEAEHPAEWWQTLLELTERYLRAAHPRPPPSIPRFFKAMTKVEEKQVPREPEEDADFEDEDLSKLDRSTDGGDEDADVEGSNEGAEEIAGEVVSSAEMQAVKTVLMALGVDSVHDAVPRAEHLKQQVTRATALLPRLQHAIDIVNEATNLAANERTIKEELAALRKDYLDAVDYVRVLEENGQLRAQLEKQTKRTKTP
jgi:hypothetical protein